MREQGIMILLIFGFALPIILFVLKRTDGHSQIAHSLFTKNSVVSSISPVAREQSDRPADHINVGNDAAVIKMDAALLTDGLRKPEDDQKFQTLADMSPAGIFLTDSNGDCIYVNQSWLNLSGLQREQAIGPGWADAVHPDDREQVWAEWDLAVTHERMFKMDFRFQQPSGKVIWIAVLCSPYRDQYGKTAGYVGVIFDITEQKALQMKLDMANRQFRHAENIAKIGSWRLTLENLKLEWSEQIFRMHQLPVGAVPDFDSVFSHYPGDAATELDSALRLAIEECEPFDFETDFVTETGVRKRVRNLGEPEFKDGEIVALVGVVQDVTDQSRLREKLRNVARLDELTEIANRKEHNETLEALLGQESCPVDPVALFLIDLDNFKTINDNLGHPAGDKLLIQVAQRLAKIPDINLVSRIGGDEFAIIKQQRLNDPDFRKTARQLESCFDDDFLIEGQRIDASASFGAAISSDQTLCPETLVKSADIALYVAKDSGSKNCRFYDQQLGELYHRSGQLRLDLKTALKNDQLRLCYQPIVSLERQKVISFEALLRWSHPELGEIAPDEFIPLMEQANLIVSIGDWVILEACRQASKWPEDIRIAVNISAIQLKDAAFSTKILRALAAYQLKPSRLELEITETVLIDNVQEARKTLTTLQKMGVRIALDDFGTGYSSLSYLRSFAFNNVKIDQSFIRDAGSSEGTGSIISAIINLGEALNFQTVAEGIENVDQLDFLKAEGCDQVQGYFLSKPVPPEEIYTVIARLTNELARVEAA